MIAPSPTSAKEAVSCGQYNIGSNDGTAAMMLPVRSGMSPKANRPRKLGRLKKLVKDQGRKYQLTSFISATLVSPPVCSRTS